jgi:NAD(P)H-dependent FMN reductase
MTDPKPKILAFAGSTRRGSYNAQLVQIAAKGAESAGAEVTIINLGDFPLPIFNEDLEKEGQPENARRLKELFVQHDGLLISSPEYNSSVTPLLKNTIDWVSRGDEAHPPLAGFTGKVAGIMAASPGGLGGLRGLVHLRSILGNIGVLVIPQQIAISKAFQAFNDAGELADPQQQTTVLEIGQRSARLAKLTITLTNLQ